jgi:ATP-dependent helicase IRC3
MANLVSKIPARSPKATKTLVLAHREELLEQAQRQISSINPTLVREFLHSTPDPASYN